jgi:GNAT superfamily N-acetyltransferase
MGEDFKERLLQAEDVPGAFLLSAEAGWNQTEDDWRTLLGLAPNTCWAVEIEKRLAATTTLLCYGKRLGWIGMVLTRNQCRRRGIAKRLLAKVLSQADEMGIETLKLDATEQGRPLYEQFGFQCEQEIERWQRPGEGAQLLPIVPHANDVWRSFDSVAFGADRSQLLEKLNQRLPQFSQAQSYLFARQGRVTAHLGPCVSEDPITARSLFSTTLQGTSCGWSWDLLPANREAAAIAQDLGFAPQRQLLRMARGKELRGQESAIYAIAGFELG